MVRVAIRLNNRRQFYPSQLDDIDHSYIIYAVLKCIFGNNKHNPFLEFDLFASLEE